MRKLILSTAALLCGTSVMAEPLDRSAFTAEIQKVWNMRDQWRTVGYQNLLKNPDLTEGQVKYVRSSLLSQKGLKGDDLIGAFNDYQRFMADYPDAIDDQFYRDYDFLLSRLVATAERVQAASVVDEQYITDVWNMGYWMNAIGYLYNGARPSLGSVMLQDFQRTRFICASETPFNEAFYKFKMNDVEYAFELCEALPANRIPSPQPWFEGNIQEEIATKGRLAAETQAEMKVQRFVQ